MAFKENDYLTSKEDKNLIYFDSDEELRIGAIKSKFNCPNCGSNNSIIFGLSPLGMIHDKYPNEDRDTGFIWEEKHICKECETIFYIENGT